MNPFKGTGIGAISPGWGIVGVCLVGLALGWLVTRWMRGGFRHLREGFQAVPLIGGDENAPKLTEAEALAFDMLKIARINAQDCPDFIQTSLGVEDQVDQQAIRDKRTAFTAHLTGKSADIKARFWNYASRLKPDEDIAEGSPPSMLPFIEAVMQPQEDDTYQVSFPLYMSVYALAIFEPIIQSGTTVYKTFCARVALFDYYMQIQKALTETVFDSAEVGRWNVNPKEQSCVSLKVAEGNLREAVNILRTRVQDLSGITFTLANLRDENMDFQKRFQEACTNALSDSCKQLANQEPILFPLLAELEGVSSTAYEKEEEIDDALETFGTLYAMLGCQNTSGMKFTFSADTDLGTIDAETLRMKLQTLSPYYISPDTMKYITDFLISPDDVQDELMRTSDVFAKINTSVGGIRRLSGLAV